jgi:hypothetical protein
VLDAVGRRTVDSGMGLSAGRSGGVTITRQISTAGRSALASMRLISRPPHAKGCLPAP